MVKGVGSVRYLALFCSLLVLGCTAPNTSVSETPPPQVIRPENTHVLRDTSAPRKDTGHLQVTPLPAPYKSWEAFYDDFFSEDESVSFRTQGLVQVANYNLPSLTANMKYGGTPWKIKDIPYRFNLPQVLKETDKTNAFFQVAELGRDDNNKLFVSKVILAISLYKRQDVSEHYEVKNWMNRHFYSEDGITFEAREPTDGEKNYTLLKASYKDLTPYEKNRDYGHSTASYADLTTCNSYYRVESGTRAVNYPVNILSLSGPGAPDENGKMYATATGQVKSVFYGTASHRASFYCPVESTSDNDNSLGEISSDAYFTFNALWDPNQQISCYKTEGSTITGDKWYYDSLSEVPKIFSVNNQQCSPCQPGALRDDSMPEICRSTSPSPTPTPTASPSPSPSSTPSPIPTSTSFPPGKGGQSRNEVKLTGNCISGNGAFKIHKIYDFDSRTVESDGSISERPDITLVVLPTNNTSENWKRMNLATHCLSCNSSITSDPPTTNLRSNPEFSFSIKYDPRTGKRVSTAQSGVIANYFNRNREGSYNLLIESTCGLNNTSCGTKLSKDESSFFTENNISVLKSLGVSGNQIFNDLPRNFKLADPVFVMAVNLDVALKLGYSPTLNVNVNKFDSGNNIRVNLIRSKQGSWVANCG